MRQALRMSLDGTTPRLSNRSMGVAIEYYRLHMPDGTERDHNNVGGGPAPAVGELFRPGLIVDRVTVADAHTYTDTGNMVTYEIWLSEERMA
jgi:hypothetical protein